MTTPRPPCPPFEASQVTHDEFHTPIHRVIDRESGGGRGIFFVLVVSGDAGEALLEVVVEGVRSADVAAGGQLDGLVEGEVGHPDLAADEHKGVVHLLAELAQLAPDVGQHEAQGAVLGDFGGIDVGRDEVGWNKTKFLSRMALS